MEYKNVVRDFAQRTRANLEFVRTAAYAKDAARRTGSPQVYEVTQLINSMLGLLVFPQQSYFRSIPSTPLEELPAQGWPLIKASGGFPDVKTLSQLMRYLRNAIAHFNIEFLSPSGQLEGVRIWNEREKKEGGKKTTIRTWQAELSLDDLERLTDRFIQAIEEWTATNPSRGSHPRKHATNR